MKRSRRWFFGLTLSVFFMLAGIAGVWAHHSQHPNKMIPGMPFIFFDLQDLNGQRWVSTYLQGKPVIILTGHRYQKYEMLKWADMLKREFGDTRLVHVLWVQNLSKYPGGTSRRTILEQWRAFGPPVPVLMDWHGVIGHALRVNYGVPNIVAIDAYGRFVFHEMHTFTPEVYAGVSALIRPLLVGNPEMPKPPTTNPIEPGMADSSMNLQGPGMNFPSLKKGKKGDSN